MEQNSQQRATNNTYNKVYEQDKQNKSDQHRIDMTSRTRMTSRTIEQNTNQNKCKQIGQLVQEEQEETYNTYNTRPK